MMAAWAKVMLAVASAYLLTVSSVSGLSKTVNLFTLPGCQRNIGAPASYHPGLVYVDSV